MWKRTQLGAARTSALLILVAITVAGCSLILTRQAGAAEGSDTRAADRTAIGGMLTSLGKAFDAADAKALSALWTAEGEYQNDAGVKLHGHSALESSFAGFFAKAPEPKAEVHPESLRFLSSDAAVAEGTVAMRRGPAEPARRADYTALLVRDGGRWRIAQFKESSHEGASVEDLAWLIGKWKSVDQQGAEIQSTYAWAPNKKFINVTFSLKEKALALDGNQVIGVDPATGTLRSWTFEASGGVAEADWERDGDHWVLRAIGTLADGRTLAQTNVLRRINNDTLTWQSVERKLADADIPDLPPVKVTRVKAEN